MDVSCFLDVVQKYFQQCNTISVITDNSIHYTLDVSMIIYNLSALMGPVIVMNADTLTVTPHDSTGKTMKAENIVIAMSKLKNIADILNHMSVPALWNSRARFLLLTTDISGQENMKEIFSVSWKLGVVNIILIVENTLLTFRPYSGKMCENDKEIVKIGKCVNGLVKTGSGSLYEEKLNDLRWCKLRVTTTHIPPFVFVGSGNAGDEVGITGIEAHIIRMMAAVMKCHLHVSTARDGLRWGYRLPNGSWVGLLGELHTAKAHIGLGALVPTMDKVVEFDMTVSYYQEQLVLAVPNAGMIPAWKNVFLPFSGIHWYLSGIVFLLSCLCMALYGTIHSVHTVLLSLWSAFLGVSLVNMPVSHTIRIATILWVLYSFITTSAYQGALVSFLTSPVYLPNIDSMTDLVKSGMPVGGSPNFKIFFDDDNDSVLRSIHSRYQILPPPTLLATLDQIAQGRDYATILIQEYILLLNKNLKGEGRIHMCKEILMSYPLSMYAPQGSPFLLRMNEVIPRIVEAGFVNKWRKDLTQEYGNEGRSKSKESKPIVLSLSHLVGVFAVLLVGLLFSGIVLVFEVLCHTCHIRINTIVA